MRVLIDGVGPPSFPRGIGRYVTEVSRALAVRTDVQVTVVVAPWQQTSIAKLQSSQVPIVIDGPASPDRVSRHIWHLMRLHRIAQTLGADVIHLPDTLPARSGPVATVCTIHDLAEYDLPEAYDPIQRRYRRWVARRATRIAERIITVSEFSRARILHRFPDATDRLVVIPNGPGLSSMTARSRPTGAPSGPFALFVGGLQRNKNVVRLIEAFASVSDPALELVIAGPPSNDSTRLERLIARANRVRWLPQPSDAELAWLYSQAEVYVLPTLYEGFGLPFLEAMSFGVPVIGPDFGAALEVIGDAGILVDPRDVAAIGDAITALHEDPELRTRFAKAGRRRASAYSWDSTAAAVVDVYKLAMEGFANRAPTSGG